MPVATLLLGLHLLPALANPAGGVRLDLAEHVRMPPDELGVHCPSHLLEVALTLLLEQQGQEVDLEEQVAELVEQLCRISRARGVGDLVGLLHRVRHDRARCLLPVPGAVAAQPTRQCLKLLERLAERHTGYSVLVDVVPVVAAGGGLKPTAYETLSS